MTDDLRLASETLEDCDCCIAVVKDGAVKTSQLRGILPMMRWLKEDENALLGASVADKVVGKAAAMLMAYGRVKEVYAQTLSESAETCLSQHGIPFEYGTLTKAIINRQGTGPCPMETAVSSADDPKDAYIILAAIVKG